MAYALMLKEMRERTGMNQKEAAEKIGITPQGWNGWELGKRKLNLMDACKVCDILGCSLDELAGREWPPAGQTHPHDALAPDERLVLDAMGRVNEDGRAKILDDASLVAESPRYAKSAQDESAGVQGA